MLHIFAILIRRAAALALFVSAFFIVFAGYFIMSNAPDTASADFSDEDIALSLYIIAILSELLGAAVCFSAFLLIMPKPEITSSSRKPVIARLWYYLTLFFASVTICLFFAGGLAEVLKNRGLLGEELKSFIGGGLSVVTGSIAGLIFYPLYRAFRLPSASEAVVDDKRPPIVFLRSFRDEDYQIRLGWKEIWKSDKVRILGRLQSLESVLAKAVAGYGPFVALGKPRQLFPTEGASRDWVDEDWESRIIYFLQKASAVIILPGTTAGLAWELSWLSRNGLMSKVAFVMPPVYNWYLRRIWKGFCRATEPDRFVKMPGEEEVLNAVLLYTESGRLCPIAGKRNYQGYLSALMQFFEKIGSS